MTKRRSKQAKEHDVTDVELQEIQEAFALFATADSSDEPTITRNDLKRALTALNAQPTSSAELVETLETLDPDNLDSIGYEHFLSYAAIRLRARDNDPGARDEEIAAAYKLFTKGENRDITLNDLRRVARELREEVPDHVLKDMIREATGGGLGGVGADDFEGVMRRAGVLG